MNNATPAAAEHGALPDSGTALGKDISAQQFKKGILLLFLVGLVIRAGFFIEHAHTPSFGVMTLDQIYYDTVAKMLLAGDDLHELHGFRPLLYPMFLAACYKIGGAWGVDLAIFVQHLLGVATGLIVALLGARLFRHRLSGLAGGLLFLLAPVPLYFEGEVLIEPSYIFLIFVNLLLILRAAESGGWKSAALWFLCGGLTVLASQARANILVFMAVYPLFICWRWWQARNRSALLPALALAGGLAMAVVWGIVNMKQTDHFHLMPNAGGVALYLGNKRTADGMVPMQERRIAYGERYQDSVEVWAREEYESAMRARGLEPDKDPMAISRYWTRRTVDEIKAAPGTWLRLMARKCWLTLWNVEVPNNKAFAFLQQDYVWLRLLPIRWVVLLVLAPIGIRAAARHGNRDALFVLLVYTFFYSAANIVFFICDRYRYPVWPTMAAFAGGGLLATWQMIRLRETRKLALAAASMVLLAALSLHNWFGVQLPTFARDYMFRSIANYEKGHFAEALDDINRSVELDPTEVTALSHQGNVLFALNRFDEAAAVYQRTLKLQPDEASVWNNLGKSLDATGRTAEALDAFRRATELQPPSKNAFLNIAFVQIRSGHFDEAATILDQFDQRYQQPDATALVLRSLIAKHRGNDSQAQALMEQAHNLDADTADWALKQAQPGH
jgi:tetratricopeptide (TPR) repeat protein